ncbi:MAG: hypothetical protein IPI20_09335 [Rhodoferax sp.]|nr:hypothetical protein [Rhodoferax sp.]
MPALPAVVHRHCSTSIRQPAHRRRCVVAGSFASVLLFSLPLKLGLIAACLFGLMAGLISEKDRDLDTRKAG